MYKKNLTTSFFETDNSKRQKHQHPFNFKNKENVPIGKHLPRPSSQTRTLSETTLNKLNAFALPEAAEQNESRTPVKRSTVGGALVSGGRSCSQGEDRVKWRISPPPQNGHGSNQKLSINEMFDIYQASQHSTETPIRHLDRSNDLWSRYDSAEPLPYLDLELSPSSRGVPKSESKLRRTTSLPVWIPKQNDRKRKRTVDLLNKVDGKVHYMMQQVQSALIEGDHFSLSSKSFDAKAEVGPKVAAKRHEIDNKPREDYLDSEDFGDDVLDDADLIALVDCVTPGPRRAISNPLPFPVESISDASRQLPSEAALARNLAALESVIGQDSLLSQPSIFENQAQRLEKEPIAHNQRSPGASSNYSIDFEEADFLIASQLVLPPAPEYNLGSGAKAEGPEEEHQIAPNTLVVQHETRTNTKANETASIDLLQGLDEDSFSDFEAIEHHDVTIHYISGIKLERYSKGNRLTSRLSLTIKGQNGCLKQAVLEDDWAALELRMDDAVRFHGPWASPSLFVADNRHGLVIAHPDVLVSATSIADSHTCMRKSVLQDRVRATSSLSKALIYGSILHALLQDSLAKADFTDESMRLEIENQVASNLEKLFLVGEAVEDAKDYLYTKVVLLQRWAGQFFGQEKFSRVEPMRGKDALQQVAVGVRNVLDIEERFWSPLYGLKGNVDVTAEMHVSIDNEKSILTAPLEFKTGKTEYQQSSYRAQVMLYTLMVSERYHIDVPAGFLYFLESGQVTRVAALHNEVRGLIIMRNELARNMKNKTIPGMISNKRICGSCYAAEACLTYHKTAEGSEQTVSSIEPWFEGKSAHMTDRDVQFFRKWESLITREEGEMFQFRHELWHLTSKEREQLDRCFGNLMVVPGSEHFDPVYGKMNQWTYKLRHASRDKTFSRSQIVDREPVIISDETGSFAISCGFVSNISTRCITVNIDRPLRDSRSRTEGFDEKCAQTFKGSKAAELGTNPVTYRIDRDEFKNGMGVVRNNLIALFLDPASKNATPSTERHKNLVVDLVAPAFDTRAITETQPRQSLSDLNVDQIKAKNLVMSARDYALILGMPGTGKTTTIAQIIGSLVSAGKSVLLTSYTHSAVDTIIMKLAVHDIKVLRLGSVSKIHPDVLNIVRTEQHNSTTFEELEQHYMSPNVVATTCLSINHAIFQKRRFDYCIFDEASQATLPVCLGPLRFADKFVLVGDHYQLPPLVRDLEARTLGLDVSLFKILCEAHPQAVVELKHQYRMNKDIMSISNRLIYGDRLVCGSEALKERTLSNIALDRLSMMNDASDGGPELCKRGACWLEHTLDPARKVVYLNTDFVKEAREAKVHEHILNQGESTIAAQLVKGLIQCGLPDTDIGVISPYRSQLKLLNQDLESHPNVMIDTADKFQGRDKECIIVSLVRSNEKRNIGELLRDWRRINVAFTRAKSKMIIIGSQNTLANDRLLNDFLQLVHNEGWAYDLPSNALSMHAMSRSGTTYSVTAEPSIRAQSQASKVNTKLSGRSLPPTARQTKISTAGARAIRTNKPILRDVLTGMQ